MLRLIGSSNIEIELREKEKWFSSDLLRGLAMAISFHIALFLCFRIASSSNLDTIAPLSPVAVEVDLGAPPALSPSSFPIAISPIEKIDPPQLPDLPSPSFSNAGISSLDYSLVEPDFSQIEKIEYTSGLIDFEEENDYR